ncbi:MAG: hypothetical protein EZS28_016808 [Streblomastix strix]|uniref:Reverse transcriptase domain-containing protein n=1 Tax=Streblomastix strix TaxID=222440 RepID=A0A5J4VYJ5_9EUKA|nr:MAG: hypothetical protein EZS28_016808 [Streblomastix strix]
MRAHQGLHKKQEGVKRIEESINRASNLAIRRGKAAYSANFVSEWLILVQVWRHQQEKQLPKTLLQRRFRLIFKDNNGQQRLQQTTAQCPFQENQKEMQVYKVKLLEDLQEEIIDVISNEQVKQWNPIFLVSNLSVECRKILDACLPNKEIQPLHFLMKRVNYVGQLLILQDWAIILDLKSAFDNLIVNPPCQEYLAFQVDNHHHQYRTMPFRCNRSPIFFSQAFTVFFDRDTQEKTVFDLRRLIAIGTFAPAAKEIYHICQYSCMKITILQIQRLSPPLNLSGSNKNDMEYPTNSLSIRVLDNKTIIKMRDSKHRRLTSPVGGLIFVHLEQHNSSDKPSSSNSIKNSIISQYQNKYCNRNCTMRAGSTMIFKINNSFKQITYPWTVKPMPRQGDKHGKPKKFFYNLERWQHSSWTKSRKRMNFLNLDIRQNRAFQGILVFVNKWTGIKVLETLPLSNEKIGRIFLRI